MALTTLNLAPNPAQEEELHLGKLSMGTAGAKPELTESLGAAGADRQSSGSPMGRRTFIAAAAAPFVISSMACAQEKTAAGHVEVPATQGTAGAQSASTGTQTAASEVPGAGLTAKEYGELKLANIDFGFGKTPNALSEQNNAQGALKSVLARIEIRCEENWRGSCTPEQIERYKRVAIDHLFSSERSLPGGSLGWESRVNTAMNEVIKARKEETAKAAAEASK